MNVQLITARAAAETGGSNSSSTTAASNNNVSEDQFLQLLVAQLQHQDPTSPTDSTTFVTQLAQFSSLEQLVAMRGDLDTLAQGASTSNTQNSKTGGN